MTNDVEAEEEAEAERAPGLAYTSVANPRWANAEHTMIDCEVVFTIHGPEPLPFSAVPVDPGWEHGEAIFAECVAGKYGPIAPFRGR